MDKRRLACALYLASTTIAPWFEGTPSNLHSSGSETPSPANGKGPVTQAPPPQPRPQQQQQSQQRPTPQREAKEAPAPRPPAPEATQAELVRAEKTEPEKQFPTVAPRRFTDALLAPISSRVAASPSLAATSSCRARTATPVRRR